MSVTFKCPKCGCLLHAAYDAAGQRVNCPNCQHATDVPCAKSVVVHVGQLFANGLAAAPVVLGMFALFFAWVPVLGAMMSIPLGLLGILLGAVGFLAGLVRKGKGLTKSVVGVAMCVLAIMLSFVSTRIALDHMRNAADKSGVERRPQVPQSADTSIRDSRVMTIDGHRADAQPPVDPRMGPGSPRGRTPSETTIQRTIPRKKPRDDSAAFQLSTPGETSGK